ncbi:MAG TPA: bacteriohopanetetrol glucosamine biosynthesis glycosyltransferase HpnI [Bryobacteraceae bacterium]|nr:bacteriohopanetetrol glucosamine biosynthesis glycosyltransferase HpnI [Bryobacteraceae bacterium]
MASALWWVIGGIAAGYQLFAIAACLWHLRRAANLRLANNGVSILKPVRGSDPGFYSAIRTQASQDHAQFEILFGVRDPDDSAIPEIQRLIAEFPAVAIRLIHCTTDAPNRKVGVLIDLAREARYPVLVVSDSDISVPSGYLGDVTAPLADPAVGLVTCLYRAEADSLQGRFEALAIATDFAPSTLVAPFVGISEFGLGSTLAFRRDDLQRIGGFRAIADYLADDYQLGRKLHSLGLRNLISHVVVSTRISPGSWSAAWKHQVRWARTIRLSRGAYVGLPVTYATFWAVLAGAFGHWQVALVLLAARFAMAITAGWFVLRSPDVLKHFYLIPFRDLWGVGIWAAGLFGDTVEWRGRRLKLTADGKIIE